jgi:hypothetical protein
VALDVDHVFALIRGGVVLDVLVDVEDELVFRIVGHHHLHIRMFREFIESYIFRYIYIV